MNKILITGSEGMVGAHLVNYYIDKGEENNIVPTYYNTVKEKSYKSNNLQFIKCDVRDFEVLRDIITKHRPAKIFHLAAQSLPTVSWEKPTETMEVNANGTINIFEAIKHVCTEIDNNYDPVVIIACSSAEYGASLTPENTPVNEDVALLPLHPYGVSKVAQDLLAYQYYKNFNIRCIRARIFNTTGPGKTNDVTSDFITRAIGVKEKKLSAIKVGNLETRRAIMDVRDLVNALVLLSDKGKWGEAYNISGDKVYQIKELLPVIENAVGIKLPIEQDKQLMRISDEPVIYGDSTKLKKNTGWQQQIRLEQTVRDMINYIIKTNS